MDRIVVTAGEIRMEAELRDTPTAQAIVDALPLEASANVWGDEIYFDVPLELPLEDGAKADVNVGDVAYWPAGPAFCIFFGPTPVSTSARPRAYSAVNVFGRVAGDATALKAVAQGAPVKVTLKQP